MTLDHAAEQHADRDQQDRERCGITLILVRDLYVRAFRAGAQWQQQQENDNMIPVGAPAPIGVKCPTCGVFVYENALAHNIVPIVTDYGVIGWSVTYCPGKKDDKEKTLARGDGDTLLEGSRTASTDTAESDQRGKS